MKKIIETQRAPGAIGPYVQGVDLGSMVFTSGQIPVCPQTGEIPADVQDQARLSLENVKAIVVAAGLSVGDIIKMTVFITDLNDFATINEVYKQFFDEHQVRTHQGSLSAFLRPHRQILHPRHRRNHR